MGSSGHAQWTVGIAFILSVCATRALINWLLARRLVAVENDRTMHQGAIPQGGGAAVMASILTTALVMSPGSLHLAVLMAASLALAALSAFNDQHEIAFPWRLAAHLAAAALALALIPAKTAIFNGAVPFALDRGIALVALAWFINLYNFMDGIDGITGVETLTIAGGTLLVMGAAGVASPLDGLALSICGAAAGFLVWNWHRARIFLGDVGSIPLGLLLGALLLHLATTVSLTAAIILPLYYLTDATLTLARRFWSGEKVWQAHRAHAYQRAARAVGSHAAIVIRIAACNTVLIAAALLSLHAPHLGLASAVLVVAILMWTLENLSATPNRADETRRAQ